MEILLFTSWATSSFWTSILLHGVNRRLAIYIRHIFPLHHLLAHFSATSPSGTSLYSTIRHIFPLHHLLAHLSATAPSGTSPLYSTIWHISPVQHHLAHLSSTAPFGTSLLYSTIRHISPLQYHSAHLAATVPFGTSRRYSTIPHFPITQTFDTIDVFARHVGIAGSHVSSTSRIPKNVPANLLRVS
jgi:hypothetical protein